ncbi:NAD-binding protein, partial [candidate division KSB1 bacterium]|nr:NAD-binding protein [candidate division KSB1 bacterium]
MNIIIIGAGDIGYNLAKMLSLEKHDIFLIEKSDKNFSQAAETLDVQVIKGSGTSYKVLEKAGIKDTDLLISVTNSDEINLLSALIAKHYGVKRTVVRVKNREFLQPTAPINAKKFKIDLIIHPESVIAQGA